ncbi:MAG TPA: Rrf2 family transcriptional regulator [Vicinamibacterales bacterium]|nr:Rrf2 family transcriptional regulator [Vicinamibacterales bacterium]
MRVADIIQAIDGPVTVTACSSESDACDQFEKCNIRDPLWRIKDRILAALATCTVQELAVGAGTGSSAGQAVPVALHAHF